MKILLINPPGSKRYLRDCYCSTISKGAYLWQPADLLSASAILRANNEISIVDCIAENLSEKEALKKVGIFSPDIVFMLISTLSLKEDIHFANLIKSLYPDMRLICSGEPVLSDRFLETNTIFDGIVRDYTNSELKDVLREFRDNRADRIVVVSKSEERRSFKIGQPLHNSFPRNKYWIPFVRLPFATLITDIGCPFGCRFCNSNFHYAQRDLDEILSDIKEISSLGYRHVFIKDMTFGIDRRRSLTIAKEISKYKMTFNCYIRIDLVDTELLSELKHYGLRLIQFGIEDYDEDILLLEGKSFQIKEAIDVFAYLRRINVYAGAHFIINLPSRKGNYEFHKLANLIRRLSPSYVSLNIFTPRIGSPYWEEYQNDYSNLYENNKMKTKILMTFLSTPSLIIDPLKDIRYDNFLWYLKSFIGVIKG